MTTVHFVLPESSETPCGELIATATVTRRLWLVTCAVCRQSSTYRQVAVAEARRRRT